MNGSHVVSQPVTCVLLYLFPFGAVQKAHSETGSNELGACARNYFVKVWNGSYFEVLSPTYYSSISFYNLPVIY